MMTPSTIHRYARLFPAAVGLGLLGACSGGSDGGSSAPPALLEAEPNNDSTTAQVLTLGRAGHGDVDIAGDIDFWSVELTAGQVVQFEMFGTRLDQEAWDFTAVAFAGGAPTFNVPRLTVWADDGSTKILEHDYSGNFSDGWQWGSHDLDIPMYRVPASGTYYISVTQDNALAAGGDYAIRARLVVLPGQQIENEILAAHTNDTVATAQLIVPGTIAGFHADEESDWFEFEVESPSILRFTMTAYRNGVADGDDDYYDPLIEIIDTDGVTPLASDDDTYFYDSSVQGCIETPGTYFVRVSQWSGSDGDAPYFLRYEHTTAAPTSNESEPNDDAASADTTAYGGRIEGTTDVGDVDFFAFPGTAGDMVMVRLFDGDNCEGADDDVAISFVGTDGTTSLPTGGGGGLQTESVLLTETGTHYVRVAPGGSTTKFVFELVRFSATRFESEPNDLAIEADTFGSTNAVSGVIDVPGATDFFTFSATENQLCDFEIFASSEPTSSDGFSELSGWGSDLYPKILILDSEGNPLAFSDSEPANGAYTESITDALATAAVAFVAPADGTYFISVTGPAFVAGVSTPTWTYALHKR